MGMTYIDGVVRGPEGREETVRFLVDSGAGYSLLPRPVWKAIGLEPIREQLFKLGGRHADYAERLGVLSDAARMWRISRNGSSRRSR